MEKVGQQAEGAGWEQVPVVEISGLYSKDEAKRREVAALIGRACREVGFFYVSNHNVPHPLIVRDKTRTKIILQTTQ
jgi:isopenicillin N synthase-like dioxygenase